MFGIGSYFAVIEQQFRVAERLSERAKRFDTGECIDGAAGECCRLILEVDIHHLKVAVFQVERRKDFRAQNAIDRRAGPAADLLAFELVERLDAGVLLDLDASGAAGIGDSRDGVEFADRGTDDERRAADGCDIQAIGDECVAGILAGRETLCIDLDTVFLEQV